MEPYITFDDIRLQFSKTHNQFRPTIVFHHENNTLHSIDHIEHLRIEDEALPDDDSENNSYTSDNDTDTSNLNTSNNNNNSNNSNNDDFVNIFENNNNNNNNSDNNNDSDNNDSENEITTTTTTTTTSNLIRDTGENDEEELKVLDEKVDEFVACILHEPHTGLTMYDNYGFLVDQDMVQIHIIYKDKFLSHEKLRKQQWLDFIEANPSAFQHLSLAQPPMASATTTYRRNAPPKPLKEMIRRGVPTDFRSSVWMRCSGAYLRLAANPDEYYNILKVYNGKQSVATKQIAMDIDRTFPEHKYLNTPEHLETLSRVLTAYSWRNPKVGYCQCMNFIVGYLLLHMSEHEAYWTLVAIVEDILPTEYYTTTMIDLSVDVRFVFDDMLQKKLPKLHKHFTTLNLSLPLIMTQWFLCIMATATPTETTFRIWDVFFSEGSKVLFRFAISLFKINEEKLLTCNDYNTLYNLIRKIPSMMYDADHLIEVAFNKIGSFPMKNIDQKRKESKVIVYNEYVEFQMMRNGLKRVSTTGNLSPPKKSPTLLSKKRSSVYKEA